MRTTLTILLFSIFQVALCQQYMDTSDPKEIKSILSKRNTLNGFGGASLKMGPVHEEDQTLIVGAYGGVLINRNFMLGVAGYGIASQTAFQGTLLDGTPKKLQIKGGYAGLMLGGTMFSKEVVHINIPLFLGAGAIYISDENFFNSDPNAQDTEFTIESSTCFVIEPGAEIEVNLTKGLRFAAGATYRYVEGLELTNIVNEDLISWTGMISLRFGRF